MTSRDQFEKAYAEDNGMTLLQVVEQRMASGSYRVPAMSRAWFWWQESRAAVVVELPAERKIRHIPLPDENQSYNEAIENCRDAIEAAGLKVAS